VGIWVDGYAWRAAYPGTRAQNHRHRGCPSGSPRCKWRTGPRLNFCFRFSFFELFCFSRLSSLFPVQSAYPRANKQIMPALECYPGARYLYIYAYVREGPTLELPWSYAPVYMRRPPTLELPCTYPGAACPLPAYPAPTLEQESPHRRGSRVGSPAGLGRFFPLALPSLPPSPRAPQGPQVSQKPPAPRLPWSSPWTPAGPLEGAANGRATWPAWLGLAVQFAFSAKTICMGKRPNRLTDERAGGAYPGATLEPRRRGNRTREADERPRPARGETPTLEPGNDLP